MKKTKKDLQNSDTKNEKNLVQEKEYRFGGITEINLEKLEDEILHDSTYLDVFAGSSIVFKDNIFKLTDVLPSLLSINCIKFDYKQAEFLNKNFPNSPQIGVIAEDIQKIFPELVKKDDEGHLHVNYSQLSTVAIAAVKELSKIVTDSNDRINNLEEKVEKLLSVAKVSSSTDKL